MNVAWALLNGAIGYVLFVVGKILGGDYLALFIFFAGIAAISTMLSIEFQKKQAK